MPCFTSSSGPYLGSDLGEGAWPKDQPGPMQQSRKTVGRIITRFFISPPGKRPSFYEPSGARFALEFAVFHDHPPPRHHRLGHAIHMPTLIRAVIHTHVMSRGADRLFAVRIEDHYVGVGADGNRPLLRE